LPSDPVAGAPAVLSPAVTTPARGGRIRFAVIAAIAVVGAAAAGRFTDAALVALVVALGTWLGGRLQASTAGETRALHDSFGTCADANAAAAERSTLPPISGWAAPGERALCAFADWFMPLTIALAAAVLMRSGDVAFALTLLLVASPQALLALPRSSRFAPRALAALAVTALLGAALGGLVGLVAAALLQQASMLVVRLAPRVARLRAQRPT